MNQVALTGRVGRDAELKYVGAKNTPLAAWSIAVSDGWGDHQKTYWIDCEMWGERAEKLSHHVLKGSLIGVAGQLRQDVWENDGQKRSKIKVVVRDLDFLSKKGSSAESEFSDDAPF